MEDCMHPYHVISAAAEMTNQPDDRPRRAQHVAKALHGVAWESRAVGDDNLAAVYSPCRSHGLALMWKLERHRVTASHEPLGLRKENALGPEERCTVRTDADAQAMEGAR